MTDAAVQSPGRTVSTLVFRRTMRAFSVRMRSRYSEDTCAAALLCSVARSNRPSHRTQAARMCVAEASVPALPTVAMFRRDQERATRLQTGTTQGHNTQRLLCR